MDNKTSIFNVQELRQELVLMTLNEVIEAMEFKGYNAVNQLVGYLMTNDSKYITTFNNSYDKKMKIFNSMSIIFSVFLFYLL